MTRRFEIPPRRLERWLDRWADAHAGIAGGATEGATLAFTGGDGARLVAEPPFPPVRDATVTGLLAHVTRPRVVAVLLVRLGAHAAGVFVGGELIDSKVARRHVHGRHRKGGSSSGRFARRRNNQVTASLDAAVAVAARVLVPRARDLEAVVLGGDRRALAEVIEDARLAPLRPLVAERIIDVPEPRLDVLRAAPERFLTTVLRTD